MTRDITFINVIRPMVTALSIGLTILGTTSLSLANMPTVSGETHHLARSSSPYH